LQIYRTALGRLWEGYLAASADRMKMIDLAQIQRMPWSRPRFRLLTWPPFA
jgi:hypothetical protein